jgi:hypothetical protein
MTDEEQLDFDRMKTARDSLLIANARLNVKLADRTWVGLTDEEIWDAYMKAPVALDCNTDDLYAISRTVEAKLKEKNT